MPQILRRLMDFAALIMVEQVPHKDVPALAHKRFFAACEQDTAVYCYGPYEDMEHNPEEILVIKFLQDSGLKISLSWQGTSITIECNLPNTGWDYENGQFGLGGDWWKK
jgi:hypothetical protein